MLEDDKLVSQGEEESMEDVSEVWNLEKYIQVDGFKFENCNDLLLK